MEAQTSPVQSGKIPEQVTVKRPAEPPRPISRPSKEKRLKKSTFLGYLLYLQKVSRLSEDQERYLLRFQSTVQEQELLAAIELLRALVASPRSAARAEQDLQAVQQRCPRLHAKLITPEKRRIGVGYKDKGSLRPTHRPSEIPGRMWWSEDLRPALLEENIPEEPRWITAEELFGLKGYTEIQELSLRCLLQTPQAYLLPRRSQ